MSLVTSSHSLSLSCPVGLSHRLTKITLQTEIRKMPYDKVRSAMCFILCGMKILNLIYIGVVSHIFDIAVLCGEIAESLRKMFLKSCRIKQLGL